MPNMDDGKVQEVLFGAADRTGSRGKRLVELLRTRPSAGESGRSRSCSFSHVYRAMNRHWGCPRLSHVRAEGRTRAWPTAPPPVPVPVRALKNRGSSPGSFMPDPRVL